MDIYDKLINNYKIIPSKTMQVLVLSGGKGTRLESHRKIITKEFFPLLSDFYGQEGPKGLALIKKHGLTKPLLDYHLDIHANQYSSKIYLGLGFASDIMSSYVDKVYHNQYKTIPIINLIEKKPAGTIASFVKMYTQNLLSDEPLILANGDNLLETNLYNNYLLGLSYLLDNNINTDSAVINFASSVLHKDSNNYGLTIIDTKTNRVLDFIEKQSIEKNAYEKINGENICWINSGFSLIVNPLAFAKKYISSNLIETCAKLENGLLAYKEFEKMVKYETLFEKVAKDGFMVAVKQYGFWADSGSENLIKRIEDYYM